MKRFNSDKRNYLIIGLCAILLIMAVGYAAFAQELAINSTAEVTSTWDVHIKNDPTTENVNLATSTRSVKTSALTAEFECELTTPGVSTITYVVPVINEGSLNAKLTRINVTGGTSAINVATNPTNASLTGTPIILNANGGEATVKIVISYNDLDTPPTGADATANITVTLDFVQTADSASERETVNGNIYTISSRSLTIGDSISDLVEGNDYVLSVPSSYEEFIRHKVVDDVITESYACLKYSNSQPPVCLRGGRSGNEATSDSDSDFYSSNLTTISDASAAFIEATTDGSCDTTYCSSLDKRFALRIETSTGSVATYNFLGLRCGVSIQGVSSCTHL